MVVAIDARRRAGPADPGAGWEVVVKGGREPTGLDAAGLGSARRRRRAPASSS